ncbi:MAG TPA: hypothetical protein VNU70_05245 [Puia sp.]|jgi:hypothetical protein|nr:hypothetical protein [Puia sp.]
MDTPALIADLNRCQGWELSEGLTIAELEGWLAERLNEWIRWDFNALVSFLYRMDISESRLRALLKENPGEDAGSIIARMVLERQWQKIESRKRHRPDAGADESGGEERW